MVNYLVGTARTNDISVTTTSNYLFGPDNAEADTYTVKMLGSAMLKNEVVLKVRHNGPDRFIIPLRFWLAA